MLHKSTKFIAFGGFGLLAVSLVAFFTFLRMVELHKNHFVTQTRERAELEAHREAISTLMRTLDETKAERESLLMRLIREEDVIDFLALIESLGKEQGVSLTTNSLTVEPGDARFETLVIKVTARGSYTGVMQVLKMNENLPYHTTITDVRIGRVDRVEGEEWESTYSVKVTKLKKV